MKIGKKIYFDIITGQVLVNIGERQGDVVRTSIEQDIDTFKLLSERNRESFDVLELAYGQYAQDFAECNGYGVNINLLSTLADDEKHKALEFSYPDPNDVETQEPVFRPPLSQQVQQLEHKLLNANQRYLQLDKFDISLDELKQFKLEQLKYFCSEALYAGFISSINEYEFGFNELDQANFTQQTLLIVAAGGNYTAPIAWKTKNLGVVELTVTDFNTIINEAAAHKLTQQNKYWQLEQEVLQAAAPNEVDAIVW